MRGNRAERVGEIEVEDVMVREMAVLWTRGCDDAQMARHDDSWM